MKIVRYAMWSAMGLCFAACGSDGGGKGGSYANISASLESPTGTVSEESAPTVAEEFERAAGAQSIAPFGRRDVVAPQSSGTFTLDCPASGSISATANQSGNGRITYGNCCYEAECCINGNANYYASSTNVEDANICIEANLSVACEGQNASAEYFICVNAGTGEMLVLVEVDGETFSVSGNYSNGNGQLDITGANGSFSCSYSGGSGSCTGDGGESFSF